MTHLLIIHGERLGEEITVSDRGLRIGRSHANDIVFADDALSQFHCRFMFKSDGSLWVTDFASTNQTLVNDVSITEQQLRVGDTVEVGNVIFRVIRASNKEETPDAVSPVAPPPSPSSPPAPRPSPEARPEAKPQFAVKPLQQEPDSEPPPKKPAGKVSFDLGFGGEPALDANEKTSGAPRRILRLAVTAIVTLALIGLALFAIHYAGQDPIETTQVEEEVPPLTVIYEKVEADANNIFRYALRIEQNEVHIQITDIKNQRHVVREKALDESVLQHLTQNLQESRFTSLQPEYSGVSPDIHNVTDLTLIIGTRAHRVRVLNRTEPGDFRQVREMIEEFGRAELGLAALAMTPERLREMARESFLEGRKRYEEREVRHGNLAESIRHFTLAQWYLETIEPKPDFYPAVIQGLERSQSALADRYRDVLFRAERAMKLNDWEEAAMNLRVIQEMIPDRADERHQKTITQLLTVERYLRRR